MFRPVRRVLILHTAYVVNTAQNRTELKTLRLFLPRFLEIDFIFVLIVLVLILILAIKDIHCIVNTPEEKVDCVGEKLGDNAVCDICIKVRVLKEVEKTTRTP